MAAFLVRHVMTAMNAPNERDSRIRAGGPDVPVSGAGHQQLAHLANFFKGQRLHAVYSSDTRRAGETGRAIAQATGAKLQLHPGLRPWEIPSIAGKKYGDVEGLLKELVQHPDRRPPGGGQTFRKFVDRILPVMKAMLEESHRAGHHIAIVTHGRNIKTVASLLKGQGAFHPDLDPHNPEPTRPGDVYTVQPQGLHLVFRAAESGRAPSGSS